MSTKGGLCFVMGFILLTAVGVWMLVYFSTKGDDDDVTHCSLPYDVYGSTCLLLLKNQRTNDREVASNLCNFTFGHLVEIRDKETQGDFEKFLTQNESRVWLGLRFDDDKERYKTGWYWSYSGIKADYFNWGSEYNSTGTRVKKCATAYFEEESWKWTDADCENDETALSVCQTEPEF